MSSREMNIIIKAKNLAGGALKSINSELKGLDKTLGKGLSSAWKNTEKGIVIGAGAVAGGLAYSASKAIAWEDAFAGVKKTINETDLKTVGLDFNKLGLQFRDIARSIPVTAEALAHIGESAGALGIKAGDILTFTKVVAKLGVTTDLTDETASDALGHLGNVLHLTGNDFADFADSLVALGNNGASTESQIIAIAERFGAAGHSAGLAKEDILALASTTASMGIEVEAGGSALSRVFNGIATNIGTGSAKAKAFAKTLGLSAAQFKKAWQKDALGTFQDFLGELNKMDQFDAAKTLKKIGITNTRDVNAIRLLAGGYKELDKQLDVSRHAAGAMDKEAQQRFATTKSQLQILRNNADDAAITIGAALLPKINELTHKATDWLKSHQPQVQQFAADIAKGFESAVTWASKLNWEAIGNTLKTVGGFGKALLDAFLHMPSWVQVAVATGWGLNKFTGGAVGTIFGGVATGLGKALLQKLGLMTISAGVVNVNGGIVNGGGGPGGAASGLPGGSALGALLVAALPYAALAAAAVGVAAMIANTTPGNFTPKPGFTADGTPGGKRTGGFDRSVVAPNSTAVTRGPIPVKDVDAAKQAADNRNHIITTFDRGASEAARAAQITHTATLRVGERIGVLNTATVAASSRISSEVQRLAASERADLQALNASTRSVPPALSRIEGVERGHSGSLSTIAHKNFSPGVHVTTYSSIHVDVMSRALSVNSFVTESGRRGGRIQ